MTKDQKMQLLAQHVLNVLISPGDDNHADMERILDGAIDLGLVEYNDEDELVKKELWYNNNMKELIEKVNAGEITLDQMVALLAAISEVK